MADPQKDKWQVTSRTKVSEKLRARWKDLKGTEADDDAISEALDSTDSNRHDVDSWFKRAAEQLGI